MTKPGDRSYKRSWKNLLINKRYQLRFTLFMVGLAALLMLGLGIWVMRVANETTTVSMASVRGEACPKVPTLGNGAANGDDEDAAPAPSMKLDESIDGSVGDSPSPASSASPSDPATAAPAAPAAPPAPPAASDEPRRAQVQIDESSMTLTQVVPADFADRIVAHWSCELRQAATFERLERGRLRIL